VPILALESIEDLMVSVHCEAECIEVIFSSDKNMLKVKEALDLDHPFVIITSHWSCNDYGSRLPYL